MEPENLSRALMATFLGELEEHVHAINENLLALEKGAEPGERSERVQALFRAAHSLKGASRAVCVIPLESACHRLEGLLALVRDGRLDLGKPVIQVLFHAADVIHDVGNRLKGGGDLAGSQLEGLVKSINDLVGRGMIPGALVSTLSFGEVKRPNAVVDGLPGVPESPFQSGSISDSVRVSSIKLDSMMKRSGELLVASRVLELRRSRMDEISGQIGRWMVDWRMVAKSGRVQNKAMDAKGQADFVRSIRKAEGERLKWMSKELASLGAAITADQRVLDTAVQRMDEEARAIRMLPFGQIFQFVQRAVRDIARSAGKEVEVVMEGGEVEMDRAILEGLRDPLLQLARNAVDHGIETPSVRRGCGKPGAGRITVSAGLRGASVVVILADDGTGLDPVAIRAQAEKHGIGVPADERDLFRLVFLPGFSTARMITEVSGRGIGLDIARTQVENMHGSIDVSSISGQGCRIIIEVPLTLTTVRALMLVAGGRQFAVPISGVRRLLRSDLSGFRQVEGRQVLMVDNVPVTVAVLADLMGLTPDERQHSLGKIPLVVLVAGDSLLAVAVDELINEQELLVKNPGTRLSHLKAILGVAVLPDGGTVPIINPSELVRLGASSKGIRAEKRGAETGRRKRLLVADDSLTTRSLEKSILEGAGFEVYAVQDGIEAWEVLKNRGADLLVSDCDMPRMTGFDLTRTVRGSKKFRDLPVILLTGLESDADKARGMEAGANAYLLKSGFDQRILIETIRQLI